MRTCIFGENGTLASAIIERKKNLEIYSRTSTNYFNLADVNSFGALDISDSTIIFTTAISSPETCTKDFRYAWKINVANTLICIDKLIRQNNRVIFFSSDVVYGQREHRVSEESSVAPYLPYGLMKYAVEKYFESFKHFFSMRLSYVYTGNDSFTNHVLDSSHMTIYDGLYRSVVHIEDVIQVIDWIASGECNHNVINTVGASCISRFEFFNYICEDKNIVRSSEVVEPPNGFYDSRPYIINCGSNFLKNSVTLTDTKL
ncbi:NAD-dependent epimerase/dehydratase family protein [Gammaproteobacteria bacterium]|nr:NAD-dependent epimerase/dehydratase family protein [Gammaproteobacteria bacterium]